MESISDLHSTASSSLSQFSVLYYTLYQNVTLKKKTNPILKRAANLNRHFSKRTYNDRQAHENMFSITNW